VDETIKNREAHNLSMEHILTVAAMERLLKQAGAERVSEDAKETLRVKLEHTALEIGKHAVSQAVNAGRKTVKAEDLKP
jgi:histone H3/H4